MPSRIAPAAFLIHAIHAPARGNVDRVPENSPTTTSSAVMPSEKTNRYVKPNTPLRVVATQVSTAAKDRKSTRLNSSHSQISYAVFCLKKKNIYEVTTQTLARK